MGRLPCCEKAHTNKGAWTKVEDDKLIAHIQTHGEGCWRSLPKAAGLLRCGKSCRLRWINYLRPDLKRGNFTEDDDQLIIKLHSLLGNKWSLIAGRLPGRTDNEIKNYWNTHIRKKLLNMGIDPTNHQSTQEPSFFRKAETRSNESRDEKNMIDIEGSLETDLNLELQICPPSQDSVQLNLCRGSKGPCFYCSMGLHHSKDCKCNEQLENM